MKIVLFSFVSCIVCFCLNAQPGTLDKSFADNGIAVDSNVTGIMNQLALQSDGKIIAGGAGGFNNVGQVMVRYNTDGSIDATFGKGGFVSRYELPNVDDLVIGPDDEIIAVGHIAVDIKLAKYKKDGTPDSAFGYNGSIITSAGALDVPKGLALQPDGKIVVCGYIINEPNEARQAFLIRYLTNGRLDESFGKGGISVVGDINGGDGEALYTVESLNILPNNQILVLLHFLNVNTSSVYRFNADGSRDLSFGKEGTAFFPFENEEVKAFGTNNLIITRDGKIIGGGTAYNKRIDATKEYIAVSRLNADGTKDSSFGNDGLQHVKGSKFEVEGRSAAMLNDGKIIVGGREHDLFYDTFSHIAVARFNADGTVDAAFGNNGLVVTETGGFAIAKDVVLQSDNKILLGGETFIGDVFSGSNYFLLTRYNNDNAPQQQTPITRIKRWLRKHGFTWDDWPRNDIASYGVERSSNGINWTTIFNRRATGNLPNGQAGNQRPIANSNYEDPSPLSGTNYYRLQTTSTDGAVAYSNVIAITNGAENTVRISPNPARNNLLVNGLSANSKSKITVVDFSGNIKLKAVANNKTYNLNIASLKAGNYLLKIETDGEVIAKKFMKE